MMQAQDYQGMYGIIATPAKQDGDRLDAVDTVDFDETERLINKLIHDGVSGLIVAGTTGECATLSNEDYRSFAACVLDTVNRRIPTFVGATSMSGQESVNRLKFLKALGADGTLLGLPMWQPVSTKMAVEYYAGVSALFPDLSIMVYANARAFRYWFPTEFWTEVAKSAPTVSSAKHSKVAGIKELIEATDRRINFMPNDMVVQEFNRISPETTTACWATAAGMGPAPSIALMKALKANDTQAVDQLVAAIAWANEPVMPLVMNPELFATYNIQVEKTRINAAGYSKCGPTRPPYADFPEEYASAAREGGERWATICRLQERGFAEQPWQTQKNAA
jgi:dihydrodipicolinate synthase/N-acetylneuraminate lyase